METNLQANLESSLKVLKLPTMLKEYNSIAQVASEQKCSYQQYLLHLSKREAEERYNKRIKYLLKQAKFPKLKTIDDYDFDRVSIERDSIIQLCHGHFIADHTNIVFFGTPGTGKTHLAMGIGRELCLKGHKVLFHTGCSLIQELIKAKNNLTLTNFFKKMMVFELIIIDELGYIPFEKNEADLLFQFISDRYERKSLLITTNLAFSEWDKIFKDGVIASAAVDRIVHYSQIFNFAQEDSYRTAEARKRIAKIKSKK